MSVLLYGLVGLVLVSTFLVGGFLLWKKVPQRYMLHKAAMGSALKIAHEGHDVVAQVEWSDGNATFLGADYKPGDEQIVLDNGLPIEVVGHGGEPIYFNGVPVIKVKAEHAAPVDTRTAIAMGREEDGDYEIKYENGEIVDNSEVEDVDGSVSMDDVDAGADAGADVDNPGDMLSTDGGHAAASDAEVVDRKYDLTGKGNTHGVAFSLRDATDYAPFTLTPGALKKAYDIGKREGANASPIKLFLMGAGALFLFLLVITAVFVAVYKILGLGGGGGGGSSAGGGGTVNAVLPLLAMGIPANADVRDRLATAYQQLRRNWTALRFAKSFLRFFGVVLIGASALVVLFMHAVLIQEVIVPKVPNPDPVINLYTAVLAAPVIGLIAIYWSGLLSQYLDAKRSAPATVTVSDYNEIQNLDDGQRKYASIANEVDVSREQVRAVLEDRDVRVVQDVNPETFEVVTDGGRDQAEG